MREEKSVTKAEAQTLNGVYLNITREILILLFVIEQVGAQIANDVAMLSVTRDMITTEVFT